MHLKLQKLYYITIFTNIIWKNYEGPERTANDDPHFVKSDCISQRGVIIMKMLQDLST